MVKVVMNFVDVEVIIIYVIDIEELYCWFFLERVVLWNL